MMYNILHEHFLALQKSIMAAEIQENNPILIYIMAISGNVGSHNAFLKMRHDSPCWTQMYV